MPVTGIGGLFFRARDPGELLAWYRLHFGLMPDAPAPWQQQAGPTVFAPFKADTTYFPPDRQWMLNLRVSELDGLLQALDAAGITYETRPDEWDHPEVGRFARLHDPEGNPIELWEPAPE